MRFGVLGPVTAAWDGVDCSITAAMPRAILAALLLDANRPVPHGRFTAGLWGGNPPRSASASLHNHVHRLRRCLGDFGRERIRGTASGYVLDLRAGELDLLDFEELHDRGRRARQARNWADAAGTLREMFALWRGEPIADVEYPVLPDLERERLAEMRLQALDWYAEAELNLGRHLEAIADLRALVAEHPLNEAFPAHLILALYRTGRHTDALEVFQKTRIALRDELGVRPGPALADLHRRILERDPGLEWSAPAPARVEVTTAQRFDGPIPRTLPADVVELVGRDAQIEPLLTVLTAPRQGAAAVPAFGIGGMKGVGKTAFAVHVAHLVRDRFPDGQLFANLRGNARTALPPQAVLAMFLRQLGADPDRLPEGVDERSALFRSLLADRRVLVVLDDVQSAAQMAPLIPGAAGCAVLATLSTQQAGAGLPHCSPVFLDVLPDDAARRLLAQIAGPDRLAREPEATAAVIGFCAGLPLALRSAAGRLAARPGWQVRDLADRLRTAHGRLHELSFGGQGVRAAFEAAYAALAGPSDAPSTAQRAFCLLGLRKTKDIGVAEAASFLGLPVHETEHVLEQLVDAYLLHSPLQSRYAMHDLVRIFAAECAERDLNLAVGETAADSRRSGCAGAVRRCRRMQGIARAR